MTMEEEGLDSGSPVGLSPERCIEKGIGREANAGREAATDMLPGLI